MLLLLRLNIINRRSIDRKIVYKAIITFYIFLVLRLILLDDYIY